MFYCGEKVFFTLNLSVPEDLYYNVHDSMITIKKIAANALYGIPLVIINKHHIDVNYTINSMAIEKNSTAFLGTF